MEVDIAITRSIFISPPPRSLRKNDPHKRILAKISVSTYTVRSSSVKKYPKNITPSRADMVSQFGMVYVRISHTAPTPATKRIASSSPSIFILSVSRNFKNWEVWKVKKGSFLHINFTIENGIFFPTNRISVVIEFVFHIFQEKRRNSERSNTHLSISSKHWHCQKSYAIFTVLLNPPSHEKSFHQNVH